MLPHSVLFFTAFYSFCFVSASNYDLDTIYMSSGSLVAEKPKLVSYNGYITREEPKQHEINSHNTIVHPCKHLDLHCIQYFLAANADCRIPNGTAPDPVFVPRSRVELHSVNMTVTLMNYFVEGLSRAEITEFYLNKATGNVVVSFNVKNLTHKIETLQFAFHRKAKESVVLGDKSVYIFPDTTFTTILSSMPNLQLAGAEMISYVNNGDLVYTMGPKIYSSTDPEVIRELVTLEENMPLMARLYMSAAGPALSTLLIQNILCDFGIKTP